MSYNFKENILSFALIIIVCFFYFLPEFLEADIKTIKLIHSLVFGIVTVIATRLLAIKILE